MTSNGTRLVDGTLRKPLDWDQQIMPPPEQRISSPATLEGLAEPIAGPSGSDLTRRDRRWRMPEPQPVLDASETIQFNEARRLCHLPYDGNQTDQNAARLIAAASHRHAARKAGNEYNHVLSIGQRPWASSAASHTA
jgi:hypothetical protein